ncbi:MAG: hypothetical protein QMB33_08565, partial [Opitutales bacterium]
MPEFIIPFGPFHMVLLHLPIGALTAIWFLEFLLEKNDDKHKNQATGLLHLLLLLSCGLTVVLGLSYEEFGQYGDEIEQHEFWGLIFAGCIIATYLCYWIHRKLGKRSSKLFYMLALLAATITMVITAHQGGELVHGKGFLSKPFQEEKRQAIAPAPFADESSKENTDQARIVTQPTSTSALNAPMVDAINGADRIDPITAPIAALEQTPQVADPRIALFETSQAIFERNCYKCHGATKQKGGYRLDEQHSINLGGKSKLPAIVPGNVEQSELMYRMLLPHDDDDAMPPEEKDTVSPQDIDLVRQWIEAGAYWPDEAELSAAASDTVKTGDADTDQLIEQISRTGVKAEYNAWGDESIRIDLGVVGPGQLNQAIQQLSGFRNKLTWLDCSELALSSDFFQQLEQCIKLQRLHLNGTDVTDKQLDALSQLADL